MSNTFMLMPIGSNIDITKLNQAVIKEAQKNNITARHINLISNNAISFEAATNLIANNQEDALLESLVELFSLHKSGEAIFIEAINYADDFVFTNDFNHKMAKTLSAKIIFVIDGKNADEKTLNERISIAKNYLSSDAKGVIIVNNENVDANHIKSLPVLAFGASDITITEPFISLLNEKAEGLAKLSPPAFRYELTRLAKKANKTIVLPEGDEPRTIKAAAICAERGIAKCVLLAEPSAVHKVASEQNITFNDKVEIIDPNTIRENYVARLVELRSNKGMTTELAREQLCDNVVLGTMMLEANHVDGLVSGAVHTTANTIRPPLQIIKTAPGSSLVSSVFFMLMPDQVYVYGDCAINPNPTAENLADIAIQSAETALAFGIDAKVAMISYSTGSSGQGADVEKVAKATEIVKQKRPDLNVDGPLQYDAAVMPDVAKSKAPNSSVAGYANVFVFPDLNTGNTTYKAVQRSANLISIGPMLQGMRKPVNDLSRGALVDDIVYTIALTAIQATQK